MKRMRMFAALLAGLALTLVFISVTRARTRRATQDAGPTAHLVYSVARADEGSLLRSEQDDDRGRSESRVRIGFEIAPVALNLEGLNRHLVGLGSYFVNAVGGCNDCHTNPSYAQGGNPFLGQPKQVNVDHYMAGGRPFGPILSRNITPRGDNGLPAGLTLEQFLEVMRQGTDFKSPQPRLLQVMPWPVFQDMTDQDLRAIYEYLSAIPCIEGPAGLPPHPCS